MEYKADAKDCELCHPEGICCYCKNIPCYELEKQLDQLKAENEELKEELSTIQHNCNREGCKYYDDDTFKVFYECKAQKALQLGANSITTKYCDLLQTLAEIKEIAKPHTYYIDDNRNKTTTELEYDYANIVWNLEQKMQKILQKISEVENDK